jgi:hypothetical protein
MEYVVAVSYLAIALLLGAEALALAAIVRETVTFVRGDAIAQRRQVLQEYLRSGHRPTGATAPRRQEQVPEHAD